MTQGGFLDARPFSPARMGLVLALHGAALGALILAKPEVIKRIVYVPLEVEQIRDTPPPPPEPPNPPEADVPADITKLPPIVPNPQPLQTEIVLTKTPVLPDLPREPAIIEKPAPPEPVTVMAQLDTRYARDFQPDYPSAMIRAEIEGKAVVRVLVGADGRVKMVEPVDVTDPAFFAATQRQALRHWRFKPATRDGVPVESWRTMTVRFTLNA